jgi:hypothetical protein
MREESEFDGQMRLLVHPMRPVDLLFQLCWQLRLRKVAMQQVSLLKFDQGVPNQLSHTHFHSNASAIITRCNVPDLYVMGGHCQNTCPSNLKCEQVVP